ncbi:MAG TPA: ATP-binding protein [Rhizomicrobium sp.]|nr:ATP-binding protein [Rhizomicrobium sp.]
MRSYALRRSIGTKIFGAFLAMSLIIAGVGAYGYWMLRASGEIVANTYDHPMMAINFARAASVDFLQMENKALRAATAAPADRAKLDKDIDDTASTLFDDLEVADERATASDERNVIQKIRSLVRTWQAKRHDAAAQNLSPDLSALNKQILDQFDLLIEFNADHGFVSRRLAITDIGGFQDAVIGMTAVALLLALSITAFLARRIVRPLSAAAHVADRIAAGQFETEIPSGGEDETGALLNSMQVMQGSIAEQMAREKARAQSAEVRLMDAIENSGEGVIVADSEGNIALASSELARLFPEIATLFGPNRPLSTALTAIEAQCRNSESNGKKLFERLLADAAGFASGAERQLPDGRWLRITANTTREGGTIVFLSDFTEIKTREEHYRLAKLQAEAANAAKSRFLANMSHELRTPLNAIIGFSEILTGELFGSLGDPRYIGYSRDILKSGRHLLDVINDVLDLAGSESGKIEINNRALDLRALLSECVEITRERCKESEVAFEAQLGSSPIAIDGDEAKLRRVVSNLLSNAVKFTEAGGKVSLVVREKAHSVEIEVRDTGIGMTESDIQTALKPFAQVDARLERRYEGTGIGLPLAKALVESHGGTLGVQSEPGRGTSVIVSLPRKSAEPAARVRRSARA